MKTRVMWIAIATAFIFSLPGLAQENAAVEEQVETTVEEVSEPSPYTYGELTVGAHIGDGEFEAFGDALIPLWYTRVGGILFLNPRGSATDGDQEELNIGIGYRQLLEDHDIILGANVYYDSRWSEYDNQWNQLGVGVEFLSRWVDARANYYLPEDDKEKIKDWTVATTNTSSSSSTSTETDFGPVYPVGNELRQDITINTRKRTTIYRTITSYFYEQYESALEGFDAEIGVLLPGIEDIAETRLFIGYQSFDNPFGDRLEGVKGRVEVRTAPNLTLDAEFFENKDLNGTDYYIGARLHVPLDLQNLANGRNPFEGSKEEFEARHESGNFAARMTEMVMRDVKVRTQVSDAIEIESKRTSTTTTSSSTKTVDSDDRTDTILSDIQFVNSDNAGDPNENGTIDNPWDVVQEGVTNAFGEKNVFVFKGSVGPYLENVVMEDDVKLYGKVIGGGEQIFGAATCSEMPTIDGQSRGPSITLAQNNYIGGIHVINTPVPNPAQMVDINEQSYDISRAGIYGLDANGTILEGNCIDGNSYGVLLGSETIPQFVATLNGNNVRSNSEQGVVIDAKGSSGTFTLTSMNNNYSFNGEDGIEVIATNFDIATISMFGDTANHNGSDGIDLDTVEDNEGVRLSLRNITAIDNDDGIEAGMMSGIGTNGVYALFDGITTISNSDDGIEFGASSTAEVWALFADINSSFNGGDGLDIEMFSARETTLVLGPHEALADAMTGIGFPLPTGWDSLQGSGRLRLNNNTDNGLQSYIQSVGPAVTLMFDAEANNNTAVGFQIQNQSSNSAAVFLAIPSHDLMNLVNEGADLAETFLGPIPFTFPSAPDEGGIQANDNGTMGVMANTLADELALTGIFGAQANDNGSMGYILNTVATNGFALSLMGGVQAISNAADGIFLNTIGPEFAGAGVFDFKANHNGAMGLHSILKSENGPAVFLGASSQSLFELIELIDGTGLLPFDLPSYTSPNGSNEASENGAHGILSYVDGDEFALQGLIDVVAFSNTTTGAELYTYSDNIGVTLGAGIQANQNGNNGMNLMTVATNFGLAGLFDYQANDNGAQGILNQITAGNAGAFISASSRSLFDLLGLVEVHGLIPPLNLPAGNGPNEHNNNGAGGLISYIAAPDFSLNAVIDGIANNNGSFGFYSYTESTNGIAASAFIQAIATNNGNFGFSSTIEGDELALLAMMDFIANDNGVNGVQADLVSSNGHTISAMLTSQSIYDLFNIVAGTGLIPPLAGHPTVSSTWGPNQANGNGTMGVQIDSDAWNLNINAMLDIQANSNGVYGLYNDLQSEDDVISILAGIQANSNGIGGIYQDMDAGNMAIGGLFDFQANNNGGIGVAVDMDAGDEAFLLSATSRSLVDTLGIATNFIGLPIGPLPQNAFGPNQANNNDVEGIAISVNGDDFAGLAMIDTEANNNMLSHGIEVEAISTDGMGVAALLRTVTTNNALNGVDLEVEADETVIAAMLDFIANDNGINGIDANLVATDADVYAAFGSSREVVGLLDELDAAFFGGSLGITNLDLTVVPTAGPNQANDNGQAGILLNVDSDYDAITALLDIQANNNGLAGIDVDITAENEFYGGIYHAEANNNGNGGILFDVDADETAIGAFIDIIASSNANGRGVEVNLSSDDDHVGALFAGITANGNQTAGLYAGLTANNDINAGFTDIEANDAINGNGIHIMANSANGDIGLALGSDPIGLVSNALANFGEDLPTEVWDLVPTGGIHTHSNANHGVRLDLDTTGGSILSMVDHVDSRGNGKNGIRINADAGNDIAFSVMNSKMINNSNDGLRAVTSAGGINTFIASTNVMANNGNRGVFLNASGGTVVSDFGGGLAGSAGMNSIYQNANKDFRNAGSGTVSAQSNWWGQAFPNASQFSGAIDYTNALIAPAVLP